MRALLNRWPAGLLVLAGLVALIAPISSAHTDRRIVEPTSRRMDGERFLGALPGPTELSGAVVLEPRDEGALERFIARASEPSSSRLHDYLRPGAFGRRFGPTAAARRAVVRVLRAQGLAVAPQAADSLLVRFRGSARDAEHAFATRISSVRLSDGAAGRATSAPVTLPESIAGSVAAVVGLDDTVAPERIGVAPGLGTATARASRARPSPLGPRRARRRARARAPRARAGRRPLGGRGDGPAACPTATADALRTNGLTDEQIASAYGAEGLYAAGDTGAGQHIGVYELEPFLRSDLRTFDTCYFGASRARAMLGRLRVRSVDGGQPHGAGSGEATLDVEDLSALAPGADIDVYVGPNTGDAPSTYDALNEYAAIVDSDRDQVVSVSYGLCEQATQRGQPGLQEAENLLFQQAAAQGQTVFAAAGDNGADDCDRAEGPEPSTGQNPVSTEDPASQPYVVGVGGTSIDDPRATEPLQHVWNGSGGAGAGGGGISTSWEMPSWQQTATVPGLARPGGAVYRAADAEERATGYPTGFCDVGIAGAAPATPCRLVPDVSAQGDPGTGAITVYSRSFVSRVFPNGWSTIGGTSSATPIWAASLALVNASPACQATTSGGRRGVGFVSPALYAVASAASAYRASFSDVTRGDNDIYGLSDGRVYAAGRGYDLATGLGTPRLTDAGGTAGLAVHLCEAASAAARPAVTGVSPSTGAAAGGEALTIHGDGFAATGSGAVAGVQIGSIPLPARDVRVLGPHTIRVSAPPARRTVPPMATPAQSGAGAVDIVVTLRDGLASPTSPAARFVYAAAPPGHALPTVGTVLPAGGIRSGGQTVTILGSGLTGARAVTIGGAPAPRFRVLSDERILAVTPPLSSATACAALPDTGVYRDESPATDVCQTQVRVRTAAGTSATAEIRPPFEGMMRADSLGDIVPPRGCGCEVTQAASEYDYLPRPEVSSISTDRGASSLASERGGTVITVHGVGLDPLDLDWTDVGPIGEYASVDVAYVYLTGTTLQVRVPRHALTAGITSVPFSVRTVAGQSPSVALRYAGLPVIARVRDDALPRTLNGIPGAPDTGGAPLTMTGRGLTDQLIGLRFVGLEGSGLQYHWSPRGTTLRARTVSQDPGPVEVQPCTVTGCSPPRRTRLLLLFPPGTPSVTSLTPASGPAAGGTRVLVGGSNLGCALSVDFGAHAGTKLSSPGVLAPCGANAALSAKAPAGVPGTSVPVTVTTLSSYFSGTTPRSRARFSYP